MKCLQLLPIGNLDPDLLVSLARDLPDILGRACELLPHNLDPEFARHTERQQYHSSEIISRMQNYVYNDSWRILGVTAVDLYIPILTFVFGEAQMGGPCAVVSLHRLRQEFYGLPEDSVILQDRLLKEAVHEIGHTMHLTHCDDYNCAMAPSHAVEWVDLKSSNLCAKCQSQILEVQHSE